MLYIFIIAKKLSWKDQNQQCVSKHFDCVIPTEDVHLEKLLTNIYFFLKALLFFAKRLNHK